MSGVVLQCGYTGPAREVADLIAASFSTLAVAEWLVPDDRDERLRIMAGQFEMLVAPAQDGRGHVDAAVDGAGRLVGAAVWHDNTEQPVAPSGDYERRLAELSGPHLPRFQALDEAFEKHHPDPVAIPHHHLAFCGVEPAGQRQGIGTMLLRHGLDRLDETGAACYLEAANDRLTYWYGQYGFERSEQEISLPGGPSMFPMLRPPGTGAPS